MTQHDLRDTASPESVENPVQPQERLPWIRLIVGTLSRVVLIATLSLALWAAGPALLGWKPTTVSSGSMMPRLWIGDIAVSRPLTKPPRLEQVLLFDDPDQPGKLRMHRFVRVDDQGRLVTRGDANQTEDSSPITQEAIRGVAILRIPFIGLPIVWLREGRYVRVAVVLAALLLLSAGSRLAPRVAEPERREDGSPGGPDDSGEPDHSPSDLTESGPGGTVGPGTSVRRGRAGEPGQRSRARRRGPQRWRTVGASVVTSALLVGGSSVVIQPAWARYTDTTSNPVSSYSAAPFYTCSAAAMAEPAFLIYPLDDTTGTSAADVSGNARNGTYRGTTTKRVADACPRDSGTAVTLNGSTGYISTPTLGAGPQVFSVQTWFKTTTGAGGLIIAFGSSLTGVSTSVDRVVYMINTGRVAFGVNPSTAQTIVSPASYNDGAWHQVTATLASNGMRLYIDGSLVSSNAAVTGARVGNGYWRIGYDTLAAWPSVPTSRYFAGTLDNVAIYTSALTASSVDADYEAGQ